jgi:hypothetical protein
MATIVLIMSIGLAACAVTAGQSAVFSAELENGSLKVFADDSYEISVLGAAWLQGGATGVHINGTWWTAAGPAAGQGACATERDIDCRGSDLYYVNDTSGADACCAACAAEPRCAAWTWTAQTGAGAPAPPVWANRCYLKTSCIGRQAYAGHVSGTVRIPEARLVRAGAVEASGEAALGAYRAWNITYRAGEVTFITSFMHFPKADMLLFAQWFPEGARAINITRAVNQTVLSSTEFASSMMPSTMFPSFTRVNSVQGFGVLTWAGRFASAQSAVGLDACAALEYAGGAEGGPLVLFNASGAAAGGAIVWAPYSNFKATILG